MVATKDLPLRVLLDEVLGNFDGDVGRMPLDDLVALVVSKANVSVSAGVKPYGSVAEGLEDSENGEYFSVIAPDADTAIILYKKVSGNAVEQSRLSTSEALQAQKERIDAFEPRLDDLESGLGDLGDDLEDVSGKINDIGSTEQAPLIDDYDVALEDRDPTTGRVTRHVDEDGANRIIAKTFDGRDYLDDPNFLPNDPDVAHIMRDPDTGREVSRATDIGSIIGDFLPRQMPLYAPWRMRRTKTTLLAQLMGVSSAAAIFAVIGDSWSAAARHWLQYVYQILSNAYGDAGRGWVALAWPSGTVSPFNGGGVLTDTVISWTPGWTSSYDGGSTVDIGQLTSSTVGAQVTLTYPAGQNIVHLYASSGTIKYRFNGGAWTEIAIAGNAQQAFVLAGAPQNVAGTIDVEVVSGTVRLNGFDLRTSAAGGVRFHKLAKAGTHTAQWVSPAQADFVAGLTALQPTNVIIFHAVNDQWLAANLDVTNFPVEYGKNLATLIDRARLAAPNADILLITSPAVRVDGVEMPEFEYEARRVAILKSVTHLALQFAWGEQFSDYAYGSVGEKLDSTPIHPNSPWGRATNTQAILEALTPLLPARPQPNEYFTATTSVAQEFPVSTQTKIAFDTVAAGAQGTTKFDTANYQWIPPAGRYAFSIAVLPGTAPSPPEDGAEITLYLYKSGSTAKAKQFRPKGNVAQTVELTGIVEATGASFFDVRINIGGTAASTKSIPSSPTRTYFSMWRIGDL